MALQPARQMPPLQAVVAAVASVDLQGSGSRPLRTPSPPASVASVLLTWDFFASREDFFATPEHRYAFSDSVASPLTSAFSAAGGGRCLQMRFGEGKMALQIPMLQKK